MRSWFTNIIPVTMALIACSGSEDSTGGGASSGTSNGSSGAMSSGSSSGGSNGSSGVSGSSGAMQSKCVGSGTACFCGDIASSSTTNIVSDCSKASTGSTRCCASNEWPGAGSCNCSDPVTSKPNCQRGRFGDTCICGLAQPDRPDQAVASCTAKAGGICCVEAADIAPTCACYDKGVTTCRSGSQKVSSCSTADLRCKGQAVDVCR
jgi:hypothetical protein